MLSIRELETTRIYPPTRWVGEGQLGITELLLVGGGHVAGSFAIAYGWASIVALAGVAPEGAIGTGATGKRAGLKG